MLRLILTCALGATALGCTAGPTQTDLDKSAFRTGKADDTFRARFCRSHGYPADCDVCEAGGYYDDDLDECDTFCSRPDPDCGVATFTCDGIEDGIADCVHDLGRSLEACIPAVDTPAHKAAVACCEQRRTDGYCDALPRAEQPTLQWRSGMAQWVFSSLANNDGVDADIGVYTQGAFDAGAFHAAMRFFDGETRGCTERDWSRSREDGAEKYRDFVRDEDPYQRVGYMADRAIEMIASEDTRAVFASVPRGDGHAGRCGYWDFYVFLDDGTAVHLTYDTRHEEADPGGQDHPEGPVFFDAADDTMWRRMHEYGGNGGSSIGRWSPAATDYETLSAAARAYDNTVWGCEGKRYSASTAEAIERFDAFFAEEIDGYWRENYLEGEWETVENDFADFRAQLADPTNLGMLSSEFQRGTGDYSESCLIWDFYALRANGTAFRFSVNNTN